MVQAYNDITNKYDNLQATSDLMKGESACLTKKLNETEATIFVRETELKKVELIAKYYEKKSHSIEIFTIVKIMCKDNEGIY